MEITSNSKSREGAIIWLIKIIAGLLIVILLGLHFIVNHLVAPGGLLSYADVLAYYQVPVIPFIEAIFLVVVIAHAFIGIRSIVLDLNPSNKILSIINGILIVGAIIASGYGIWLIIVVVNLGSS